MNWTDHLNRVIQEQAKLVQLEWRTRFDTVPVQDTEKWLEQRDEAVDQSIEHFLETGQWGELSRDDQPALFYRLWWMGQLLVILSQWDRTGKQVVPDPSADEETIWPWAQETCMVGPSRSGRPTPD
jgi:hypothetical protein